MCYSHGLGVSFIWLGKLMNRGVNLETVEIKSPILKLVDELSPYGGPGWLSC